LVVAKRKPAYVAEPWRYPQRELKPQRVIRKKTGVIQKYAQVALVMFIFSVAVSVIGHYSVLTGISYKTTRMQREISSLKEQQYHLQLEAARLSSLDRIEYIAKNELGLVYPDSNQLIFLTLER
jgi:cell division protein FtsL